MKRRLALLAREARIVQLAGKAPCGVKGQPA
jgi:hypothetical protein